MDECDAIIQAAVRAGELIRESWGKQNYSVENKGPIDLVTEVDRRSEDLIVASLRQSFPDYGILAEEGNRSETHPPRRWIIDPLDGTTNFVHGLPMVAVSIGLEIHEELVLGVVYNPIANELFVGEKGQGATLNHEPIHVSPVEDLGKAVLASGFPYDAWTNPDNNTKAWSTFLRQVTSLRCDGSAALDLCQVACGRLDGYWEKGIYPWDMAAGVVIVREAGGLVSDYAGRSDFLEKEEIVVANPALAGKIRAVLQARSA